MVLWIYIIMTMLACFYRSDFLNGTICVVAFYMINEPYEVKKWTFKLLTLGVFISIIYDVLYFMLNDGDLKKVPGGDQSWMITVGYYTTLVTFFFKFIVALVFWKDSIDFNRIIRKQKNDIPNKFAA